MLLVPSVKVVLVPATSSLVGVGANLGKQLIALAILGNRHASSIQESLEARVGPGLDGGVELIFSLQASVVGGTSILVSGPGSSGTDCLRGSGRGAGRQASSLAEEVGTVLASKSKEFITFRALGNLHVVLVEEFLQLGVGPGVEQFLAERGLGRFSRGDCRRGNGASLQAGQARVAADGGNKLVTVAGLRDWPAALVQPFLQVRLRPLRVQPITRVRDGLASFLCNSLVVFAGGLDQDIMLARLRSRNAMTVEECLELRL